MAWKKVKIFNNWKKVIETLENSYENLNNVPRPEWMMKDIIQNSWDARKDRETAENWIFTITLMEKEHWVLDIDNNGIYNALIVAKPGNSILLEAINHIVVNVKNRYYGNSCLEPTGPLLLAKLFSRQQKQTLDMKHMFYISMKYRFILFNNYF